MCPRLGRVGFATQLMCRCPRRVGWVSVSYTVERYFLRRLQACIISIGRCSTASAGFTLVSVLVLVYCYKSACASLNDSPTFVCSVVHYHVIYVQYVRLGRGLSLKCLFSALTPAGVEKQTFCAVARGSPAFVDTVWFALNNLLMTLHLRKCVSRILRPVKHIGCLTMIIMARVACALSERIARGFRGTPCTAWRKLHCCRWFLRRLFIAHRP